MEKIKEAFQKIKALFQFIGNIFGKYPKAASFVGGIVCGTGSLLLVKFFLF